jgi:biotin transport system substrate-specific component
MIIGLVACYSLGAAWFVLSTQTRIWNALLMCVIPFLIGDFLKIILAATISQRLRVM